MTDRDVSPVPRWQFVALCRLLTALVAALVEDGGLTPDAAAEFTAAARLVRGEADNATGEDEPSSSPVADRLADGSYHDDDGGHKP